MRRTVLVAVLLLAGCGNGSDESSTGAVATAPEPSPPATVSPNPPEVTEVRVYFLRAGRLAATKRTVPATKAVARVALTALAEGPTDRERELGFETEVPVDLSIDSLAIEDGTARVDLSSSIGCPALAQVVYTLTQFPTVQRVATNCVAEGTLDRTSFEDVAPAVLVEAPTPFEEVASPLRLRGNANTFEATFQIEVVDWDGRIIHDQFATATSGTGTRGTFDVTIPFSVDRAGGAVIVFELSAKDGSRINVVEIPLALQP